MERAIRVPHAVVFVISLAFRQLPDGFARGKRRVAAVRIVKSAGQERGPVESPVELAQRIGVIAFHLQERQTFFPNPRQFVTGTVEIPMRNLRLQVPSGSFSIHKGGSRLHQYFLTGLHVKLHVRTDAPFIARLRHAGKTLSAPVNAVCRKRFPQGHYEVPAITGRLSPTLVNAVHGVVTAYHPVQRINLDKPLPLVAVGVHH